MIVQNREISFPVFTHITYLPALLADALQERIKQHIGALRAEFEP